MSWNPEKPYNDLPMLPLATEVETRKVLKRCIDARTALVELKQAAELIPNQTMLINTLPLPEAKDSSEIENIVTTTDKLTGSDQHNLVKRIKFNLKYARLCLALHTPMSQK